MLTPEEVEELLSSMRRARSDTTSIEAKRAKSGLPGKLWETISAFANSRGGGLLLLGVDEQEDFVASGVSDAGKLQADLASICGRMVPPIRAAIDAVEVGGRMLVACEIPETPRDEKPCYYGPSGVSTGAYVRVGDGDRRLTQYEIQILLSERRQPVHDAEAVPEASFEDLDAELVAGLVARLRASRPRSFGNLSEVEILTRVNALKSTDGAGAAPTVAGMLALGSFPQQFFPQLNVTFVVYPDVRKGQPGPSGERFLDNEAIDGSIPEMVVRSLAAIRRNMKRRSVVSGAGRRDMWEYPETALREAIVNAIVHRDLSPLARGNPVQVEMYPDRVEVRNPGGLYGPISVEDLLSGGSLSSSRNPILLRLLEDTEVPGEGATVCENRGSGIPAMIASLREAGLGLPILEDRLTGLRQLSCRPGHGRAPLGGGRRICLPSSVSA